MITVVEIVQAFVRFGRRIMISPKANAKINAPGYKVEIESESVVVNLYIGAHHSAILIMGIDAWKALNEGAECNVLTSEEYKKKYASK